MKQPAKKLANGDNRSMKNNINKIQLTCVVTGRTKLIDYYGQIEEEAQKMPKHTTASFGSSKVESQQFELEEAWNWFKLKEAHLNGGLICSAALGGTCAPSWHKRQVP